MTFNPGILNWAWLTFFFFCLLHPWIIYIGLWLHFLCFFNVCLVYPTPHVFMIFVWYVWSFCTSSFLFPLCLPSSAMTPAAAWAAWQGTDLMHNHVLADVDRSCVDSPGRRSSMSRPELSSDLSEDSDYDSIWTTHSYRMGSVPRKSCISHQN